MNVCRLYLSLKINNEENSMDKEDKIILYTIGCPNCKMLEKRLDAKNIKYTTVTDIDTMQAKGIKSAPQLEVNGEIMNFGKAIQWVQKHGNNN